MRVAVFSARSYDRESLIAANKQAGSPHELDFLDVPGGALTGPRLTPRTAALAKDHDALIAFTNDQLDRETLTALAEQECTCIALRCAGFNNLDLEAARELGFLVGRVPAYSPHAVAEHAVALILALNRKLHRAFNRVREHNFSLAGLLGFDLNGKTVTIVGTGAIGAVLARIMLGFGCRVLAVDPVPNPSLIELGITYHELDDALPETDILCLKCPLTEQTHHLINERTLALLKPGAMLVNTARGAIVDTPALIRALKSEHLSAVALDVYEEEEDLFFEDRSQSILTDDLFARLLTFPNVLITSHQAFFTKEAVNAIAETTIANLTAMADNSVPEANRVPGLEPAAA
ncbi:MAG: 2-hydroxyacid dehydrogenase [Planctomycetota bacterium]